MPDTDRDSSIQFVIRYLPDAYRGVDGRVVYDVAQAKRYPTFDDAMRQTIGLRCPYAVETVEVEDDCEKICERHDDRG